MRRFLSLLCALLLAAVPARADFGDGNGLLGNWSRQPYAQLEYISKFSSTTDATTYSAGNFTAPQSGLMIVGVLRRGANTRTLSSVSIGGTDGTIAQSQSNSVVTTGIASRRVSAGSQAVTFTLSGTSGSTTAVLVCVWFLAFNKSDTATGSANVFQASSVDTSKTFTITIPARGVGVYMGAHGNANATTWTDVEDDDETVNSRQQSCAHKINATDAALTSYGETYSWTSTTGDWGTGVVWN